MCIRNFVMIAACACLFGLCTMGGCDEQSLRTIDQGVQDVNHLADAAKGIAESPAGALLPEPVRLLMELCGFGVALAVAIWKHLRAAGLTVTAKSIVQAVETLSPELQGQVKGAVKGQMIQAGAFPKANAIVDKLKES